MRFKLITAILVFGLLFTFCKKNDNEPSINHDIYYQYFDIDYSNFENDTFFYDINNDTIFDIIAIKNTDTLVNGNLRCTGQIYGLNDTMLFTYMREHTKPAMLDTFDIIVNSDAYYWLDTIKYTGNVWEGIFTPNFGFQYKKKDVYYGWFHFDTGGLKEIAFNQIPNSSIRMGQKN